MIHIILLEDNLYFKNHIEKIINTELANYSVNIKIFLSTICTNEIINYTKDNILQKNIYFIPLELQGNISGINLATKIRQFDYSAYIIFTTYHSKLPLTTFGYNVQAMDYILKTNSDILKYKICEDIKIIINNLKTIKTDSNDFLLIETGNNIVNIGINDILFVEAIANHKIKIHTFKGQLDIYSSLKEIEILSSHYIRAHRSYIVNLNNIKTIDKKNRLIHMVNEEICYISKNYMNKLIQSINLCI